MPQYELNLRDYLRIISRRKFTIIVTFALFTLASCFYRPHEIPTYEAKTTIKIEERKTIAGLLAEEIISNPGNPMSNAAKLIVGFPVLKKVAIRLGMVDENTPVDKIQKVAGKLQDSIKAAPIENTNIIEITATAFDPKKAMDMANAVAEAYIDEDHLEKNKAARMVRNFIEEQLSSVEKRLKTAEDRLRILGNTVQDIRISPSIQDKLMQLQIELVALMQRYTDKYPAVKKVKGQIEYFEKQIKGFSGDELAYSRLSREVEINKKLYEMLRQKLEEARITETQRISDVSVVNPAVLPGPKGSTAQEAGVVVGALLGLFLGFALAFVRESLDTSVATIEDVEAVTKLPVLGVVPSVLVSFETGKNIFKRLKKRFLPSIKNETEEAYVRLIVHNEPTSSFAEACRNIRTNLKLNSSKKSLLITSAAPAEGKTVITINLGLTIAQTGAKTLLVATDLRRPAISKTFGVPRSPGITELISGGASLEDALRNISDFILGDMKLKEIMESPGLENIWILPSGRLPLNPAEILESGEMHNLARELKNRFDVVIFDSPPVLPVTDASLLATMVDNVILCYEVGRTSRNALLRAKTQLESVGAKISGIILNHIAPQAEPVYPYYYQYKYRYHGVEGDKLDKARQEDTGDEKKQSL